MEEICVKFDLIHTQQVYGCEVKSKCMPSIDRDSNGIILVDLARVLIGTYCTLYSIDGEKKALNVHLFKGEQCIASWDSIEC